MSVKAVLFDLDGTLTERSLKRPCDLHTILRQKGIHASVEEIEKACLKVMKKHQKTLGEQRGRLPHQELYRIWESHFLKALQIEDLQIIKKANLHWMDVGDIKLYPDVIPTLTQLRRRGVKTGIVSDAYQKEIQQVLKMVDLDEAYFDIIVGPDTAQKPKPDPEAFTYAAKKLGINPEEIIFVGNDLERDYKAAEKAGMNPFLIVRSGTEVKGVQHIEKLLSLIDYLD